MQTVKDLISEHRLVTLTGPGGCGKTRLSIEVATQLVPVFEEGVWFVDLAPITNEDRVLIEIAEALSITEVTDKPLIETVIETIREQKLMIILDNCEHLIKTCAEVSGQFVQSTTHLKILATSRESLGVIGEKVWRIPSLTLLDPKAIIDLESVRESEAVMLFSDRASLNNPEFKLEVENITDIVTICNKVEGIPLAVELVASRIRHMDPKMILKRFADRFDIIPTSDPRISKRQQTLQATIDWSYNLLSDAEKLLFVRLSVFAGGFDIDAAEEVVSDDQLPKQIILDTLSKLVDRSLVYTKKTADPSMRYNCLETIRQFGHHIIDKSAAATLNKNHLRYYLTISEEAYQEQYEDQLNWINKLEMEEDNLMTALEWSEKNSSEEFYRLVGSLTWFWNFKSKYLLAQKFLEAALSKEISNQDTRARLLFGMGQMKFYFKKFDRAFELINESLELWHSSDLLMGQAIAHSQLGNWLFDHGARLSHSEQSLEISRQIGKPGLINHCLASVCLGLVHTKQFEKALPLVEELTVSSEKLGQPWGIIAARHLHSDCALDAKDFKEAEKRYGLALRTAIQYGIGFQSCAEMQGMAFALSGQKRWKKAIVLNAASIEKGRTIGVSIEGMFEFWDEWADAYIGNAKGQVGEEMAKQLEEEGAAMGFENAVEYALDFKKD
jgi:predicted ATPase